MPGYLPPAIQAGPGLSWFTGIGLYDAGKLHPTPINTGWVWLEHLQGGVGQCRQGLQYGLLVLQALLGIADELVQYSLFTGALQQVACQQKGFGPGLVVAFDQLGWRLWWGRLYQQILCRHR